MANKSEVNYVTFIIPFMAGILSTGVFTQYLSSLALYISLSLIFLLLLSFNILYQRYRLYRRKPLIGWVVYLFLFIAGLSTAINAKENLKSDHFSKKASSHLLVTLCSEPQPKSGFTQAMAMVNSTINNKQNTPATGHLMLLIQTDTSANSYIPHYGDQLLITNNYTYISAPNNPGQFNLQSYLATKNIYHRAFIAKDHFLLINKNQGNLLIASALELRQKLVLRYSTLIKNKDALAVASTLVLGYRADLDDEIIQAYTKTGTVHALSVSGMHVGLIFLVLSWILGFMDKNKKLKPIKVLLIIILTWFYAMLTGFSPSVNRAALMLSIVVVAKAYNKELNMYNLLAFSAFCLLLYDPFYLWDVGFQLSYISVFGLVYLQAPIYNWIQVKNKLLNKVWNLIALSLAAQIATFPLAMYYFHQFPLSFIISNLFIVLPLTLIMYSGILVLLIGNIIGLDKLVGSLLEQTIVFTNNGLKYIAHLPFSSLNGIWINQLECVLLCCFIGSLCLAFTLRHKTPLLIAIGTLLLLVSSLTIKRIQSLQQQHIIAFSVKNHHAIAFIKGQKCYLLSNLNPDSKTFKYAIQPGLDMYHVQHLTLLKADTSYANPIIAIKQQQIIFGSKKILIWNKHFNHHTLLNRPKFSIVLITDNPSASLKHIMAQVEFDKLLIDGTNTDYKIKQLAQEAIIFNKTYHLLKKDPAYLSNEM